LTETTGAPGFISQSEAETASRRLRHLSEIGLALSSERDIRRLLATILSTSRELTGADGGTLYIVEKGPDGGSALNFRASQSDSIIVDTNMTFAVGASSLAGYAALSGEILRFDDVYHLEPDLPYQFNPLFDLEHGYRTKSVLVVPLKNHDGAVIGVLQLINRKRRREVILRDPEIVEREVIGFDKELADLAATLASQAAVALDNNLLLQEIEGLFEAFVVAASSAIEDRDPCTSGHSQRVTLLTMELARAVHEMGEGPLRSIRFTALQLKELRYAALLHDFGKIGVREAVLTKSHKIEPAHFEAVRNRLLALYRQREAEAERSKVKMLLEGGLDEERAQSMVAAADRALAMELRQISSDAATLERANDPSTEALPDEEWREQQAVIQRLSLVTYVNERGEKCPLLTPEEKTALCVRRGSLTAGEFQQITEHAQMSYEFLRRIPWTGTLENIPMIARSHHERNDGSGYPQGLDEEHIPLGAKIMAIADVYDALTASDRPYKKSMSTEQALEVLAADVAKGKLDGDMLKIFIDHKIYRITENWPEACKHE
jgi:HD-GYP domain-containing protein (c-di-GMP phosphodiesterase class II)